MKSLILLLPLSLLLGGCFTLEIPLGETQQYGTLRLGYTAPATLPLLPGNAKLLRDK